MSYRVVVWGPGNVGAPAIRHVISHPDLELSAVIVHSKDKVGRDAGELAGMDPVGVPATGEVEVALATRPDALVYAVNSDFRPAEAIKECCDVLVAGVNVVAPGQYALMHPATAEPVLRERFEAACQTGGSTFLSSGVDPGWAIDLLPLVLSGVCGEVEEIRIVENFNYQYYDQPDAVRRLVGMGMSMDETPPMLLPIALESVWGGILRSLGEALGVVVTEIRTVVERHALERPVENSMGRFEAGTQGGFRFEVQAIVDDQPTLIVEHITRIDDATAPQWPTPKKQGYHQVRMQGRPDMVVTIECEDREGNHAGGGNSSAAARIVNAIPVLCELPPGLVSGAELPLISGGGLSRRR